jgi:hypothetical protein
VPLTAVFAAFVSMIVFYVAWGLGALLCRQTWIKKI